MPEMLKHQSSAWQVQRAWASHSVAQAFDAFSLPGRVLLLLVLAPLHQLRHVPVVERRLPAAMMILGSAMVEAELVMPLFCTLSPSR